MRPRSPFPPAFDDPDASRLVLRDGSVVAVRAAGASDRDTIRRFFHSLPPDDRFRRFFSAGDPPDSLIDRCCGAQSPGEGLTLLATRIDNGVSAIVGTATYIATPEHVADVAFAIAAHLQGQGLGTLFLEQLLAHAHRHGVERVHATVLAENTPMLDVFRNSGFQVRSNLASGCVDVELTLAPDREALASMELRRQQATVRSLQHLLAPSSVAVIGASRDPRKTGSRVLTSLLKAGFTGRLHVVHSSVSAIQGVRAVRSVELLPPNIDLAVVCLPAAVVLDVVDACGRAGVRALLVISAGFAETGPEGFERQKALLERARGYGMRLLGPNCLGAMNLGGGVRLNASFSPAIPPSGDIGFVSQSGALGIVVLDLAAERGVGLSTFVSIGNRADISSNDLLEYWEDDPATRVVLLYLESFGNARRFTRIARRISPKKPIIALKAGRSAAGARAAGSHTAAMASRDAIVDAVFQQSGVIRAESAEEMFDIAACLDHQPLPKGRRVVIVTNAGGPGILAADACEAEGLTLADLLEHSRQLLAMLPAAASRANPIDMMAAATAADYRLTLHAVLNDPGVDAAVVIYTPVETGRSQEIFTAIGDAVAAARAANRQVPVVACITGRSRPPLLTAGAGRIPVYLFPENAVRALGHACRYAEWRALDADQYLEHEDVRPHDARRICAGAVQQRGAGWLTCEETAGVLRAFGFPIVESHMALTSEDAAREATSIGYPVVAKIATRAGQHKTDVGGVAINLSTPAEVRTAFDLLQRQGSELATGTIEPGVMIQPMVAGGIETFLGITHDPVFGPVIGFGEGGVYVELRQDVRFRTVPLSEHDITALISGSRIARLFDGYRGHAASDRDSLIDVLRRASQLADSLPEIVELDLNPVIVLEKGRGARVVDARIRVAPA